MTRCLSITLGLAALSIQPAYAASSSQPPSMMSPLRPDDLRDRLAVKGSITIRRIEVTIERADFITDAGRIEAVVTRPSGEGPHPGLLLVPGHSRTAYDMLPQAIHFARAGFATMSVSQPGYGGSSGPPDFVGPKTFAALLEASRRMATLPFVDAELLGVYGYSRGALAAAQLATRTDMFRAAVFGGGIYDFRSAMEQISPGILRNMESEAGFSDEAIWFRSPIHDMEGLDGPVLIIHGELDENAPLAQALLLSERLEAIGREHELKIISGGNHALSMDAVVTPSIDFFRTHLRRAPEGKAKPNP